MAYTFLKAQGNNIGNSICEEDKLDLANELLKKAQEKGVGIILPIDNHVSDSYSNDGKDMFVESTNIPEEYMGLDIGPETIEKFTEILKGAKTVIWNGPLGVCEFPKFEIGTKEIAKVLTNINATTIIRRRRFSSSN